MPDVLYRDPTAIAMALRPKAFSLLPEQDPVSDGPRLLAGVRQRSQAPCRRAAAPPRRPRDGVLSVVRISEREHLGSSGRVRFEKQTVDGARGNAHDLPAREPRGLTRNWSLMNRLNQKGTRPQDQPVPLAALSDEDRRIILSRYPELG